MSGDPDEITILSSDSDQEGPRESNEISSNCHGVSSTSKRRVPLQRVATGKEIFSEFLEKCKSKDNSVEMEKIIKKLWKRFNNASEVYTKSNSFKELVLRCMNEIDSKLYSTMKVICDELQSNKETSTHLTSTNSLPSISTSTFTSSHNEGLDPKTKLHIEKLERLLTQLHRRIHKLENVEVDLNSSDEENSAYVQVARYKSRFCQVFQKLCELKERDPYAERILKKHIKFSATKIPEVNKAIEKFYNDRREFPDYRDILTVVKKANEIRKLNLLPAEISNIALKAFQELGKTLKNYRQLDDVEIFRSYLPNDEDPASYDADLENTLKENWKKYGSRIDEVIDKYAGLQDEERLEPTEVDSDVKDEEESDGEEDPDSDCQSSGSILESKSDSEDSADLDYEYYPECRVVLTDVRFSTAWEKYVLREQKVQTIESNSGFDKYPTVVIEISSLPCRSRKRSHESDLEESPPNDVTECSIEPTPSTSRDFVPYRYIKRSKIEKRDELTRSNSSNTGVLENREKLSTETDSDVIEIISDSCEKNFSTGSDQQMEFQEIDKVSDEAKIVIPSKNVISDNNYEFPCSNKDNVPSTKNSDKNLVETSFDQNEDTTCNTIAVLSRKETISSSTLPSTSKIDNDDEENNSSIINDIIDVDLEDSQKKKLEDVKKDTPQNSMQQELLSDLVQIRNHFLCNDDPMPSDIVMDVDSSRGSESVVKKSQSETDKNIDSDDVVVIDEIIKTRTPIKKSNEIIDIEEISDSPEKPKPVQPKRLGQAVNLSQMIRNMKFKPETIPKNRMAISGLSNQVTSPRSTFSQFRSSNMVRNQSPNFRQIPQNAASTASRTVNGFSNMMRPSTGPFNNQRQNLKSKQFASMQSQNVQYVSNNANVTMKSSQAAMQRKQVTSRTVRTFDSRTNRMVTRREITTVVQQSVMQVVGQNRRVVNVQPNQTNIRRISSNRNYSPDDVITLD